MTATMVPARYRVTDRRRETADTVTLTLEPVDRPVAPFRPGQYAMLYAFGVGEVPISVSGATPGGGVLHTIRAVGAVSAALCAAAPGQLLGLRGPYGTQWPLPAPAGADLLVVAGGIGTAPVRPVAQHMVEHADRYARRVLLLGARTPAELLYPDQYDDWRKAGVDVRVTVDRADPQWTGPVGLVPALLDGVRLDPATTVAYLCGPEPMMRATAQVLLRLGVPAPSVLVSLERNMRCGVGLCGHCQLGPALLCRDGPVLSYDRAAPLLEVGEL